MRAGACDAAVAMQRRAAGCGGLAARAPSEIKIIKISYGFWTAEKLRPQTFCPGSGVVQLITSPMRGGACDAAVALQRRATGCGGLAARAPSEIKIIKINHFNYCPAWLGCQNH